jgi:TolB-like protein
MDDAPDRRGWVAIAVIIALALVSSAYFSLSTNNNAPIYSLAVLPFINVNADEELEYLSDGMTEILISDLSQLPKLNVKAHSSVLRYKGNNVSPHTVGADLNVQAILNGRLILRGEMLTLSLELADARTENVIWSKQYTRRQTDLVSLQSEIARDITNNLRVKLAGADAQKLSKKYTYNTEAYELYLKGRFYWNKRTLKDLEKALDYFNQAIALDPNYVLAYAGLGRYIRTASLISQ